MVEAEETQKLSNTEGNTPMVDAEEQTAEETIPKGRDSSGKIGSSSADSIVDDTENRDKPERSIPAPKMTEVSRELCASGSARKKSLDQKTVMPKCIAENRQ